MDKSIEIRRRPSGAFEVTMLVGDPDDFMEPGSIRKFALVEITTATISVKDAEAITSYEWVTGFDPETGEAIWETFGTGEGVVNG